MSVNQTLHTAYSSTYSGFQSLKKSVQNRIKTIDWESTRVKNRVSIAKSGAYATLSILSAMASGVMLINHLESFVGSVTETIDGHVCSSREFTHLTTGTQTLAAAALAKLAFDAATEAGNCLKTIQL